MSPAGGNDLSRLFVRVRSDVKDAVDGLKAVQGQAESFGTKMKKTGRNLTRRVTLPVVGLGAAIIKTAAEFESSMAEVRAVTGASADDFAKLEDQARDLGATTRFSAGEAAEGMAFLGRAGFETNEILTSMPGLLDLAAAGSLDLGRAADIASNVMSGFNLTAEDMGRISDVLAASAANANTSVEQMGQAMSFVAPVAAGAGISIEETAAAMGKLSDAGIQATRAGTGLRGILARLQAPSGELEAAMKRLGINMADVDPAANSLVEILEELESAGATSADIMAGFGQRAGPALVALLGQGSESVAELKDTLETAEGSAAEMAETMEDTVAGAMRELKSAAEGLFLAVAEAGLLDAFRSMVEWLTNLTRSLSETSPLMLKLGTIVAGFAAAAGPALMVIGSMHRGLMAVKAAAAGANVSLSGLLSLPTVAILATVAGALASVRAAANDAKVRIRELREEMEATDRANRGVVDSGTDVRTAFANAGMGVSNLRVSIEEANVTLGNFNENTIRARIEWAKFVDKFAKMPGIAREVANIMGEVGDTLRVRFATGVNVVSNALGGLIPKLDTSSRSMETAREQIEFVKKLLGQTSEETEKLTTRTTDLVDKEKQAADTFKSLIEQLKIERTELLRGAKAAREMELRTQGLTDAQIAEVTKREEYIESVRESREELKKKRQEVQTYIEELDRAQKELLGVTEEEERHARALKNATSEQKEHIRMTRMAVDLGEDYADWLDHTDDLVKRWAEEHEEATDRVSDAISDLRNDFDRLAVELTGSFGRALEGIANVIEGDDGINEKILGIGKVLAALATDIGGPLADMVVAGVNAMGAAMAAALGNWLDAMVSMAQLAFFIIAQLATSEQEGPTGLGFFGGVDPIDIRQVNRLFRVSEAANAVFEAMIDAGVQFEDAWLLMAEAIKEASRLGLKAGTEEFEEFIAAFVGDIESATEGLSLIDMERIHDLLRSAMGTEIFQELIQQGQSVADVFEAFAAAFQEAGRLGIEIGSQEFFDFLREFVQEFFDLGLGDIEPRFSGGGIQLPVISIPQTPSTSGAPGGVATPYFDFDLEVAVKGDVFLDGQKVGELIGEEIFSDMLTEIGPVNE